MLELLSSCLFYIFELFKIHQSLDVKCFAGMWINPPNESKLSTCIIGMSSRMRLLITVSSEITVSLSNVISKRRGD